MSDYLIHYGVKGMKWGVRKDPYRNSDGTLSKRGVRKYEKETKKLNKSYAKYTKKYNKAKAYTTQYKLSDEGAKMRLTPTQYARYSSSSARREQYLMMKRLQKGEKAALEQYKKHMNQTMSGLKGSNYYPDFDFEKNTYTLKKHNHPNGTKNEYVSTKDLTTQDLKILKEYSKSKKG